MKGDADMDMLERATKGKGEEGTALQNRNGTRYKDKRRVLISIITQLKGSACLCAGA